MMNLVLIKKLHAVIILSVLLVAFFMQLNVAYSAEENVADTRAVIAFLKDMFQLDTTKYEARLTTSATNYWPWLGGIAQTTGQYVLDSTGLVDSAGQCGTSILTVSFTFWDEELISCSLYEESQGPPLYKAQPATDLRVAASVFLQRYQTRTGDSQLTQMRSLLDIVDVTSNAAKTIGNLELIVLAENDKTLFTWSNTFNGAIYSQLHLEFQEGQLSYFGDNRKFYKLGSSEVNISQEEAVSIALKRVETYSYIYQGKEITDFNINKKHIRSQPHLLNKTTNPMELYPCWIVDLPLDDVYPGEVAYIQVWLWADSGEAFICRAMGYGGYMTDTNTPTSEETTQPDNNTAIYIIAAVAAISIAIAIAVVALKKRSK